MLYGYRLDDFADFPPFDFLFRQLWASRLAGLDAHNLYTTGDRLSSDTVPQGDAIPTVSDKLALAQRYVDVAGWHIFIVRNTKVAFAQCTPCREADASHDRESCDHLLCHGFYAATRDMGRVREMFARHPDGLLALRTGQPSGVIALDFESSTDDPELPTGLQVMDDWESYTHGIPLGDALQSRSGSGGVHLLYKTEENLQSRNRILPNTDLKANGGYVVLPPAPGRVWVNRGLPPSLSDGLAAWLKETRGRTGRRSVSGGTGSGSTSSGSGNGHAYDYDFNRFFQNGCPGGFRDDFINDLLFRIRKNNVSPERAADIAFGAWQKLAQPPHAKYHMPWSDVEYKLRRVYATVRPDEVPQVFQAWTDQLGGDGWSQDQDGNTVKQQGRITVVRRQR